jgi:hypothetical protein
MAGQPGFFDIDERRRELSSKGDDLERLKGISKSGVPAWASESTAVRSPSN